MQTPVIIFLNVALLFFVSIEPYLFNLINFAPGNTQSQITILDYASVSYAFDIAGMMIILAFFDHILITKGKKLISPELIARHKYERDSFILTAAVFSLSTLPQFWTWIILDTPSRYYFWLVPLGLPWIKKLFEKIYNNIC